MFSGLLPEIITPRLILRLGQAEDVPSIVDYYIDNRSYLAPWEPQRGIEFFTEFTWEVQIRLSRQDFDQGRSLDLFLFPRASQEKIIGALTFSEISRGASQACCVGYSLAENRQGQGYMTEALEAGIGYVFDTLRLHRVMANYMPRNERSGRLLRRLGFAVEGYTPASLQINGVWEDHILTSRINPQWKPLDSTA